MAQTMLLTKRLTTFLSQNTTPTLPTLLLISPTGKLLSSSSPLPASKLRTQSTLACTLWNLYHPLESKTNETLSNALLSNSKSSPQKNTSDSNSTPSISAPADQSTITIQLTDGIIVIRALKCGLLFVAIGNTPTSTTSSTTATTLSPYPSSQTLYSQTQPQARSTSSLGSPPTSPGTIQYGHATESGSHGGRDVSGSNVSFLSTGAASEAGSVTSTGRRAQAGIMAVKRQAEEVGRWLEESLEGFVLGS